MARLVLDTENITVSEMRIQLATVLSKLKGDRKVHRFKLDITFEAEPSFPKGD